MYFLKTNSFHYPDSECISIKILTFINECDFSEAIEQANAFLSKLSYLKANSKVEKVKNDIFISEQFIKLLLYVAKYWLAITEQKFSDSWLVLQDILDYLRSIKKFHKENNLTVSFLEEQFIALESSYPYRLFSSVGIVVDHYNCSVCGLDIDSFECLHLKGELYNGDIAYGIANKILHFDHLALVENPLDKRCAIPIEDNSELFRVQKNMSKYIDKGKLLPFGFKNIETISYKKNNPDYIDLPRNTLCFCGSNIKFKKCCISKKTIEHKHFEFIHSQLII
ncbi:SEC-C motif-containing protein [Pseudoalteromonas sp. DSM 26666]|uniref:SEC-C domain-containing protein n=1 Tax=Pseudoalteromonas sp. DSM 26666 TaxID=1761892 RepID=UPI0008E306F3|nr:SEC-C domain-containing protein [Pseudoalteromonas sp. DSM 26666]SFU07507.1 SEC-C motif-containing protein [Pseudoalteromonas sp. DSM 26666]